MTSSDFGYKFLDRALSERIPIDPGVRTNPFTTNRVQGPYQRQTLGIPESGTSTPFATTDDFIRSSILPQVYEAIGSQNIDRVVNRRRAEENLARQRERALQNQQREQELLREQRTRPDANQITLLPEREYLGREYDALQQVIPGLSEQIEASNQQLEQARFAEKLADVEKVLDKYPELRRLLTQGGLQKGTATRIKEKEFAPYLQYTDTAQLYSDPVQRAALYDQLRGGGEFDPETAAKLQQAELAYTSGDPATQELGRQMMFDVGIIPEQLAAIESPAFQQKRPVIGGGGYVGKDDPDFQYVNQRAYDFNDAIRDLSTDALVELKEKYPALNVIDPTQTQASFTDYGQIDYDPDNEDVRYSVDVQRGWPSLRLQDAYANNTTQISKNALRFLREYPIFQTDEVAFKVGEFSDRPDYTSLEIEPEFQRPIQKFVSDTVMKNRRPGSLIENHPLGNEGLFFRAEEEGKTVADSSYLRGEEPFRKAGVRGPNIRARAYTRAGFSPIDSTRTQFAYIDQNNNAIPIQFGRPESALTGRVLTSPTEISAEPAASYSSQPRFYSTLVPGLTPDTLTRIAGDISRTPSSLLPGAADLIPSPAAVRAGFQQGPIKMGLQMAEDFAAGLPAAAVAAPILASPAVAPLAPGIGAGLVGKAATEALNEAVRQQTGEGIVPKIRQAIGTRPRTGVASPQPQRSSADYKPAQITKATPQAVANLEKQKTQKESQRLLQLARERLNPSKGEFGLSEMLFGR